jgi:hypothetical protein
MSDNPDTYFQLTPSLIPSTRLHLSMTYNRFLIFQYCTVKMFFYVCEWDTYSNSFQLSYYVDYQYFQHKIDCINNDVKLETHTNIVNVL